MQEFSKNSVVDKHNNMSMTGNIRLTISFIICY